MSFMCHRLKKAMCVIPGMRFVFDCVDAFFSILQTPRKRLPSIDLSLKILTRMKDDIFSFIYAGKIIRFWLPFAGSDFIQSSILDSGSFFDLENLEHLMKYVPFGSVIADCGANIGNHSLFYAAVCGAREIIAFEPQAVCADIFEKNMELNHVSDRVRLERCALGERNGRMKVLRTFAGNSGGTQFDYDEEGDVPVRTLDSFNLQALDFLKIDVEGGQLSLLKGAEDTLSRLSPTILVELENHPDGDRNVETREPIAFLQKLGYSITKTLPVSDYLFMKRVK